MVPRRPQPNVLAFHARVHTCTGDHSMDMLHAGKFSDRRLNMGLDLCRRMQIIQSLCCRRCSVPSSPESIEIEEKNPLQELLEYQKPVAVGLNSKNPSILAW